MKKCYILVVLFAFYASAATAQLSVIHYQLEDEYEYRLKGFTPGAMATFYSKKNGGRILLAQTTDEKGSLLFPAGKNFRPAFVLDADNGQTMVSGSRQVHFIEEKEFVLNDLQLLYTNGQATLGYTISVRQAGKYTLEVLRSVNGAPFSSVYAVLLTNETELKNTFAEYADPSAAVLYQFRVSDLSGDFAAYSRILSVADNGIIMYPNPCTDMLYAAYAGQYECYVMRNSLGQNVRQGQKIPRSGISLAELVPGVYTLELRSGTVQKATGLIIKQ